MLISADNVFSLLLRHLLGDLQLILYALTVVLKVFSGFIYSLEEVHHVSEADIDLHLVHILEDLSSFDLALNLQCDLRSIHAEFLLIEVDPLATVVSILGGFIIFFEEDVAFDFGDVFDEEWDDLSELVDAVPQAKEDGFL